MHSPQYIDIIVVLSPGLKWSASVQKGDKIKSFWRGIRQQSHLNKWSCDMALHRGNWLGGTRKGQVQLSFYFLAPTTQFCTRYLFVEKMISSNDRANSYILVVYVYFQNWLFRKILFLFPSPSRKIYEAKFKQE